MLLSVMSKEITIVKSINFHDLMNEFAKNSQKKCAISQDKMTLICSLQYTIHV